MTISLRHLISDYKQITCPITLVCAGNRRKEQNQVHKSKGFSWGPAGVSTALFTGVAMSVLIKKAKPKRRARFVCMEGADKPVCVKNMIRNDEGSRSNSRTAITGPLSSLIG